MRGQEKMKKYNLEKVLHEIIRDIPGAAKVEQKFNRGFMTFDDALKEIAFLYREEKEKENNEK